MLLRAIMDCSISFHRVRPEGWDELSFIPTHGRFRSARPKNVAGTRLETYFHSAARLSARSGNVAGELMITTYN
jgi:hypothetical protein